MARKEIVCVSLEKLYKYANQFPAETTIKDKKVFYNGKVIAKVKENEKS